jgi:hypothetical protein
METSIENRKLFTWLDALYRTEPMGGPCHIVTEDFNVEDKDIEWCIEHLNITDRHNVVSRENQVALLSECILLNLLHRRPTSRRKALNLWHNEWRKEIHAFRMPGIAPKNLQDSRR